MQWLWLIPVMLWVTLLIDCLRSDRMQGGERIAWAVGLVLAFPLVGPAYVLFVVLDARRRIRQAG